MFDLSICDLHEIPSSVFPLCKVLQKESLLLYENNLKHLKGGNTSDLISLKILDVHSNLLQSIPQDIGYLKHLQILNLENNRLKSLPNSLGMLISLQQLNLKSNLFSSLPEPVTHLFNLRMLDISKNKITNLPKELASLRALENLVVDVSLMTYPSKEICLKGVESIMRFLCSESRIEYIPSNEFMPSAISLPASPMSLSFPRSSFSSCFSQSESALSSVLQDYEKNKERKRQEILALEKQLDEEYRLQASLAAQAAANKKELLNFISQEHNKLDSELCEIQYQKSLEKEKLLKSIQLVEENMSKLVTHFVVANERARRTEEILDQMERERLEKEQWYIVRQEELRHLRKNDITESFEKMLQHSDVVGLTIRQYMQEQQEIAKRTITEWEDMSAQFNSALQIKDNQKQLLLDRLLKEEKVQKEAFEMLLNERDICHKRIVSQISLIEQQLMELTMLELDKHAFNMDSQLKTIEDNRKTLTDLLVQLFEERDKREKELKLRLLEMEERRQSDQDDYWLVQYQRLLDSKPQSLVDQENHLEYEVIELLRRSDAAEFIPHFAQRRMTIETVLQLDNEKLIEIGIRSYLTREKILFNIKSYKSDMSPAQSARTEVSPPPAAESKELLDITSSPAECVVCMEEPANVLFLSCGHICVCFRCSEALALCPMDRQPISKKIKIYRQTS